MDNSSAFCSIESEDGYFLLVTGDGKVSVDCDDDGQTILAIGDTIHVLPGSPEDYTVHHEHEMEPSPDEENIPSPFTRRF